MSVSLADFRCFFFELHGHDPYPWQERLAQLAVNGDWPRAIDVPTGAGKTSAIDVAVFAIACQAERKPAERQAPRRIFFCVNRRVIVDEAYDRAGRISRALTAAERGSITAPTLKRVAEALRQVSGADAADVPALDVLELRGGIYRDNRWARSATQPTVVCTTVDQLGSRLLFRGYGASPGAAPIQAALVAYDSLVLLDEAHVSRPFLDTLNLVSATYLDAERWANEAIGVPPMQVVPMTATPPETDGSREILRLDSSDHELDRLNRRLSATKHVDLRVIDLKRLAKEMADAAMKSLEVGPRTVAVFVNRVVTARETFAAVLEALRKQMQTDVAVELVIGSMRPVDRDQQADRLRARVGPDRPDQTTESCIVVTTQCLEVGADFDFDVVHSEAASLDALRQRFGRLNRRGRPISASGTIFIDKKDAELELSQLKPDRDPIYGDAIVHTWHWLRERATVDESETNDAIAPWIDFGIQAFDGLLGGEPMPAACSSPSARRTAPLVLPTYLDLWCQTQPCPQPDPDITPFIHGFGQRALDVQICWRADLVAHVRDTDETNRNEYRHWRDVVALMPPTSSECMTVPIGRLLRWLRSGDDETARDKAKQTAADADVLGVIYEPAADDAPSSLRTAGVLWAGSDRITVIERPDDLHRVRPGDVIVLPVDAGGWNDLGHVPVTADLHDADAPVSIDVAEAAYLAAKRRVAVRLHPALKNQFGAMASTDEFEECLKLSQRIDPPPTRNDLFAAMRAAVQSANVEPNHGSSAGRLAALVYDVPRPVVEPYPDGRGWVITSRNLLPDPVLPALDDGNDEPSRNRSRSARSLADHTHDVVDELVACLRVLPLDAWKEALKVAVKYHDLGKADDRFQAYLKRIDRTQAWLFGVESSSAVLAKSDGAPLTPADRQAARVRAQLPQGFRHEMLSVRLAERADDLPSDDLHRNLVLHLIASHHGHARPFAPVVLDPDPPDVRIDGLETSSDERRTHPPHRLDSGIPERFWQLTRHVGWWGLAYLEAVMRLADQRASARTDVPDRTTESAERPEPAEQNR